MACEQWREKLDAYLDGELGPAEAHTLSEHMRGCPECASEALNRVQLKRAVGAAGKRYVPSAQLRAKIASSVGVKQHGSGSIWKIVLVPAAAIVVLSVAFYFFAGREAARRMRVYSELADAHVTTLASATPVDVISSDRHTVKPWFQGKIPFTFDLPELQGSDYSLVGGRVTYLQQVPGAQLIYRIRKHQISVFIFPEREEITGMPTGPANPLSFNVESWTQHGLRYFVVGDANAADIHALSELLRKTG